MPERIANAGNSYYFWKDIEVGVAGKNGLNWNSMVDKRKVENEHVGTTKKMMNFVFKAIRVANSQAVDMDGHKRYRTVFRVGELENCYVDTSLLNLQFSRKTWRAKIETFLLRFHIFYL